MKRITTYLEKYYRLYIRGEKFFKFLFCFFFITFVLISSQYIFAAENNIIRTERPTESFLDNSIP